MVPSFTFQKTGGWMTGPSRGPATPGSPTVDIQLLQEKEQRILALQAEVSRLHAVELDAAQKDATVSQLRDQVGSLQQQLATVADADIRKKVLRMEQELAAKNVEVGQLRDRLSLSAGGALGGAGGSGSEAGLRQELTSSQVDAASVRHELDRVRKEKLITSGLVTQLQRDMTNKDTTISRLTREIESLKREVKEKDVTVSAIQAKFSRIKDSKKAEEDMAAREKDIVTLRQKLKVTESKMVELEQLVRSLQEELLAAHSDETQHSVLKRQMERDLEESRNQCADVQRSERMTRVDLQEATKKYERFRNRVMQVAFSTPGIRAPDDEIRDDQLIEMLRKVVGERTEFHKKMTELRDSLKAATSGTKEVTESVRKFKGSLSSAMSRLHRGRFASALRDQLTVLQSESVDPALQAVKEIILNDLQHQLSWAQDIEAALDKCGVNVKLSSETPAAHIAGLMSRWEEALTERDRLKSRLASVEADHKKELEQTGRRLEADVESRIAVAVERANLKNAEELRQAIDDVTRAEAEKREAAVQAERDRVADLNECVARLQKSLLEKQEEQSERLQEAEQALGRLAEYERLVTELQESLEAANSARDSKDSEGLEARRALEEKHRQDVAELQERLRQAAVGSASGEERLQKATRKAEDLAKEVVQLKKEISELRNRPTPRSKEVRETPPRVIVQKPTAEIAALEKTVQTLRSEKKEVETQVAQQETVITGLRQELAAAAARLSDSRGEMSNNAKEEVSRQRLRIRDLEQQLTDLRHQMRQLADEVERQKAQILEKENENSNERMKVNRLTNTVGERDDTIRRLEASLADERGRVARELASREEEGRITSELTAMGAACRGERHESIIAHQKEALSEMRQRLKQLEQLRPQVPSHDVAMQQVAVLKKEMAEMRSKQALADTNPLNALPAPSVTNGTSSNGPQLDRMRSAAANDMSAERSAHKETQMALEVSEHSYLSLLRAMASNLELESIHGLRSVCHLPEDERSRLSDERDKACALLSQRIQILKERLTRKEELMNSYEQDLARLKQAEELAMRKHAQVETLVKDVRLKSEESELLRESLHKTKDELNQEKRLNTAIKQKKNLQPERNGGARSPVKKAHSCPPDDILGKGDQRVRFQKEKSKRREYEIHTLKSELANRERELCRATSRLVNMETTMGLNAMDSCPE